VVAVGDVIVVLWCVGWAGVAGVQGWRYFRGGAGVVRVLARVERVEVPREAGADRMDGVPVVIAFQDPGTGERLALPTTGRRNGTVDAAWVGRQVTVRFPAGRPYEFKVAGGAGLRRELGLAVTAACLVYAALVARLAFGTGDPGWAPLGIGVMLAALMAWALAVTGRAARHRKALLATGAEATARVVAVAQSTHRDDDGHTHTRYSPVVTFHTPDGRAVTALSPDYVSGQAHTIGTETLVRYAPADPSIFAFDAREDGRAQGCGVVLVGFFGLAGLALTVVGVVLLG
jgi:hypothetical protein